MEEVLLINPAKRRKARKNPSPAQRRARAAFAAMARARSKNPRRKARRRNPIVSAAVAPLANPRRRARRRNPVVMRSAVLRRRRNPIRLGGLSGILGPIKTAAIQGIGAVAMEVGYAYVNRMLPPTLQASPGAINAGTAVKAAVIAFAGNALSGVTKGASKSAAIGALTVMSRDIAAGMLPASVSLAGLGYASPAQIVNRSMRVSPNRNALNRYTQPGATALLNAYTAPGLTSLLNGARAREGYPR